ncbi:MAG: protein kinase [Deltaproteobacteria bacterium]|nr:protein kinase [Deltaproteobacteria bacterium]
MIAGLEILNLHAQGGMAEVYRARGKGADGRTWHYAVKRILPELTQNETLLEMFVEEARVASLLTHQNIVRVYDLARSDTGDYFIVMEFLEGKDVADVIGATVERDASMPLWMAIHIAREVLQALVYASTQATDRDGRALGLIHRDISPPNIFLCSDGQVKLTDFGVAKVKQSQVLTQVGVTKGKFGYMSPEQLTGEVLDPRSDLYNVGILLYEMMTAKRLFMAETPSMFLQAMLKAEVPPLDPGLGVPHDLEVLMRRALARERDQRPESAAAFLADLTRVATRNRMVATRANVADELKALFVDDTARGAAAPGSTLPPELAGKRSLRPPHRLTSMADAAPAAVRRAEPSRPRMRTVTPPPARLPTPLPAPPPTPTPLPAPLPRLPLPTAPPPTPRAASPVVRPAMQSAQGHGHDLTDPSAVRERSVSRPEPNYHRAPPVLPPEDPPPARRAPSRPPPPSAPPSSTRSSAPRPTAAPAPESTSPSRLAVARLPDTEPPQGRPAVARLPAAEPAPSRSSSVARLPDAEQPRVRSGGARAADPEPTPAVATASPPPVATGMRSAPVRPGTKQVLLLPEDDADPSTVPPEHTDVARPAVREVPPAREPSARSTAPASAGDLRPAVKGSKRVVPLGGAPKK